MPYVMAIPNEAAPVVHRVRGGPFFAMVHHMVKPIPWTPVRAETEPGGRFSTVDFIHTDGTTIRGEPPLL